MSGVNSFRCFQLLLPMILPNRTGSTKIVDPLSQVSKRPYLLFYRNRRIPNIIVKKHPIIEYNYEYTPNVKINTEQLDESVHLSQLHPPLVEVYSKRDIFQY